MLSGVGLQSTYGANDAAGNPKARATDDQSGALSGEILRDQVQLNDWLTCVSANTPKGQAEIQSLTARINAAKQHITKLNAEKAATAAPTNQPSSTQRATPSAAETTRNTDPAVATHEASRQGNLLDTWA